jgi:hypothetical protein
MSASPLRPTASTRTSYTVKSVILPVSLRMLVPIQRFVSPVFVPSAATWLHVLSAAPDETQFCGRHGQLQLIRHRTLALRLSLWHSLCVQWLTCDFFWLQLPRANKLCPSCGETEAVFFQSQQRSAETGMVRSYPAMISKRTMCWLPLFFVQKLYYVCCACGNVYMWYPLTIRSTRSPIPLIGFCFLRSLFFSSEVEWKCILEFGDRQSKKHILTSNGALVWCGLLLIHRIEMKPSAK